jgi:predicted transposase/invertase (TIGR01784 family)
MSKVNPKIDLVFKKLFASEENKDILLSLINAILPVNEQVAAITLKNPYNISDYAEGKLSILDIKAQAEDGRIFDIEIQIRGSSYYGKRALFYWAKIFGSQLDYAFDETDSNLNISEVGYSDLKKCIVISLMDFNFFQDARYYRFYTLKDGDTNEKHKDLDYLDLYFIELKKYQGKLENVKTTLERWITFLNNAHKYDTQKLPKELAEIKEIRKACQKLDVMFLDEQERQYYESQQKFWLDQNSFLKETLEKAVEQAEINSKIEIAKNAIKKGLDNQFIAELTGLSIEQIEALRN